MPWPIPVDLKSKPEWWISPPCPPFIDTQIIGHDVGRKLVDEETQEVKLIKVSTGMNIEEDDISIILKTDIKNKIIPTAASTPGKPFYWVELVFGVWPPTSQPPSWWSSVAGATVWPPIDLVAKPTWWPDYIMAWPLQTIIPPEITLNDPTGIQLIDEETQECKILLSSTGMSITEDEDGNIKNIY